MSATTGDLQLDTRVLADNIGTTAITTYNENMEKIDTAVTDIQTATYTSITLQNAFNKLDSIVDGSEEVAQIRGLTLNNFADNGIDYINHVVNGLGTTKGVDGIHLVKDNGNESDTLSTNLTTSSLYTLIYNISNTDFTGNMLIDSSNSFVDSNVTLTKNLGINKVTFTTSATITLNQLSIILSGGVNGQFVDYEIYGILEGDQTNLDIQNSLLFGISGSNVNSFKTIGKNLFDGEVIEGEWINKNDGTISNNPIYKRNKNDVIVVPNETLYGNFDVGGSNPGYAFYTKEGIYISGGKTFPVTIPIGGCIFRFTMDIGDSEVYLGYDSDLTFNKYNQHLAPINKTLNGLNNIFDTIEETIVEVDGENVRQNAVIERNNPRQFIGAVSENWVNVASPLTTVYRFNTTVTNDALGGVGTSIVILESITLNDIESNVLDEEHYYIDSSTQELNTFILKSKIDIQVGATLTDKYNNYLSSDNLDIMYNLNSVSYITTPFPEYNNHLPCYQDGYLEMNYTNAPPSLDLIYPTNKAAQLDSTTVLAQSNAKQIRNIWNQI